jgi:hypothetical protein
VDCYADLDVQGERQMRRTLKVTIAHDDDEEEAEEEIYEHEQQQEEEEGIKFQTTRRIHC